MSKVVHGIKQQLSHERSLKLDAFHQVDHLVQQVSMCNRWVSCAIWGNEVLKLAACGHFKTQKGISNITGVVLNGDSRPQLSKPSPSYQIHSIFSVHQIELPRHRSVIRMPTLFRSNTPTPQVQQFEDQPTRSTVYWASPQSVASSSMRMPPPPTPGLPFTLGLQSVSHSRLCRSRANVSWSNVYRI